jgi:hypothetical protein
MLTSATPLPLEMQNRSTVVEHGEHLLQRPVISFVLLGIEMALSVIVLSLALVVTAGTVVGIYASVLNCLLSEIICGVALIVFAFRMHIRKTKNIDGNVSYSIGFGFKIAVRFELVVHLLFVLELVELLQIFELVVHLLFAYGTC